MLVARHNVLFSA